MITKKLCEIIDLYVSENKQTLNFKYIGYENAKWALLMKTFDYIWVTSPYANPVYNKEDEHFIGEEFYKRIIHYKINYKVCIANLVGTVFMEHSASPFETIKKLFKV